MPNDLRSTSAMIRVFMVSFLLIVTGSLGFTAHAQTAPTASINWPASNYGFQNTNNDPQNVINAGNVGSLQLKWIYQVPENPFVIPGAPPALGIETQPLVENGVVYVATPYNRLIALSTSSGTIIWQYQVNMTKFIGEPWWAGAYVISGLSYYDGTLYMMSSDTTVYAFNTTQSADTGQASIEWTLGPIAKNIPGNTGYYYGEKAPIIVGDNLIVRASTTDYGGRGFVAAYNINTRNMSWIWYSTPPSTGDPNWDADQCQAPCHGNITPYSNDWGSTSQEQNYAGGGAAWGLIAVDNSSGMIYFSTGHPADGYNAALRPGPDLFTDAVVALNSTSGKMAWYYQFTSHDIAEHEGGWSVTLANITVGGQQKQVIIQGAKNNYVYVLDTTTGNLVYNPIEVGAKPINNINDGETSNANLTVSQAAFGNNHEICPGPDGGIEMGPAVANNTLFVVSQNACGLMYSGPYPYKGQTISGFIYGDDPAASQNSTIYAINLSNGQQIWHDNMPNRYQGASAVVSGGVVYAIDRGGILYEYNQQTGALINSFSLGGLGAAGVSIGLSLSGQMEVFAGAGGGDLPNPTPGLLAAYGLPPGCCTSSSGSQSTSSGGGPNFGANLEQPIIIAIGAVVVVLAMYMLLKRRTTKQSPASAAQAPAP